MSPNYLVPAAYALLWAPWISAQDSPPVVFASSFVEDQWTTEQGLVQNEVTDIEITADGSDAHEAVELLVKLVETGFRED